MSTNYQKVKERIKEGEFDNKKPFPLEETLEKHPTFQHISERRSELVTELEQLAEEQKTLIEKIKDDHRNEERDCIERFRKALEETYGLTKHPKRGKLWEMAWDKGHSCGLGEVLIYYDEFVDLLN